MPLEGGMNVGKSQIFISQEEPDLFSRLSIKESDEDEDGVKYTEGIED